MKNLINKIFSYFGIKLVVPKKYDEILLENQTFRKLSQIYNGNYTTPLSKSHGIVFSMDRAMQLNALLQSYFFNVSLPPQLTVLYKANSLLHKKAYIELTKIFPKVKFVEESSKNSFKNDLKNILTEIEEPLMFFLVDDIIFTEKIDLQSIIIDPREYIFSLRLGQNIEFSYTMNKNQTIPKLISTNNGLEWKWDSASSIGTDDWSYPFSVDGHFYLTQEIQVMTDLLEFSSPNTLEPAMYKFIDIFNARKGFCFIKSVIVNLPINKVQQDRNNNNLSGNIGVDYLLKQWNAKKEIDIMKLQKIINSSPHQEFEISFKPRTA